jgi:hypothetical protein
MATCDQCGKEFYAGDGAWDDGDYMCGECIAGHIEDAEQKEQKNLPPKNTKCSTSINIKKMIAFSFSPNFSWRH